MPTYEYVCSKCDSEFEVFQSMKDAPLTKCPECGRKGGVKRKIGGGAGLIFKGTGFYITDYKAKPSPGGEGGSGGKSEPAKTTQPAAKPAPAAGAAKS
jgi:putative FmdB family regulatory protein